MATACSSCADTRRPWARRVAGAQMSEDVKMAMAGSERADFAVPAAAGTWAPQPLQPLQGSNAGCLDAAGDRITEDAFLCLVVQKLYGHCCLSRLPCDQQDMYHSRRSMMSLAQMDK